MHELIGLDEPRLNKRTQALIDVANGIIADYQVQGYTLTLRQLYYQFVSRNILPNTERSYDMLGRAVTTGRMAGLIDWEAIEDRTRGVEELAHFDSPRDAVERIRKAYRINMWANQPTAVEVWIEKEALAGVIERTCRGFDVPYLACRGYLSASEAWRCYRRIRERAENDIETIVLHLGDHDPSGVDMTRDNRERLLNFLTYGELGYARLDKFVSVERIALNMEQVKKYNPPPNPAKLTDSRAADYVARYGNSSWELDALEPKVITKLVEKHIRAHIDVDKWAERVAQLKAEEAKLDDVIATL